MRRLGIVLLALVQVLVLGIGLTWANASWLAVPVDDDEAYTLLVLGSDEGPYRAGTGLAGRADGFHLLVVSPDRTKVSILSFPRDTWVDIPGHGRGKINSALTWGPESAVATAEAVTGMEVDDWILTTFAGFQAGVEMLGGVEVDVEGRLRDRASGTDFEPGPQVLDGTQSLAYVRDRKSRPNGDLDRAESHARFLQALHQQLFAEGMSPSELTVMVGQLDRLTESSIPTPRLFALAALAMQIPPENVARVRLDGAVGTAGSASVVRLTEAGRAAIRDVAEDGLLKALED